MVMDLARDIGTAIRGSSDARCMIVDSVMGCVVKRINKLGFSSEWPRRPRDYQGRTTQALVAGTSCPLGDGLNKGENDIREAGCAPVQISHVD